MSWRESSNAGRAGKSLQRSLRGGERDVARRVFKRASEVSAGERKVEKLEGALAAVNERLKEQDARINRVAAVELTELTRQAALH